MPLPTEVEIVDAARRLGHLDEHGKYPRELRSKLAAAVQLEKQEIAKSGDPQTGRTAEMLVRFDRELCAEGLANEALRHDLLVEAARQLLKSGLRLGDPITEEVTPDGP